MSLSPRLGPSLQNVNNNHTTELAIRLRGAVKRYGPITAVDGLDLDVPVGTCVGLLGPNGAGKSTTMRLLTAQSIADEGELEVLGYRLPGESKWPARSAASCRSSTTSTRRSPSSRTCSSSRTSTGSPAASGSEAIERALEIAKLVDRRDTRVDKLSGGMRRRLLIARALVHRPRLVLLDEPTVGLDPQVRQELWALIDALRAEGTTILMSTHYIEEAQRLADTVMIMSHGKAVAAGPPPSSSSSTPGSEARRGLRPARPPRRGRGRGAARPDCARGAPARASRSSASTATTAARPRASGDRRTSRTSSSS